MATLACISAAIDPDNPNTASAALTIIAIDGVIGMIEMSLRLMKQTPAAIVQLHPPPANQP